MLVVGDWISFDCGGSIMQYYNYGDHRKSIKSSGLVSHPLTLGSFRRVSKGEAALHLKLMGTLSLRFDGFPRRIFCRPNSNGATFSESLNLLGCEY